MQGTAGPNRDIVDLICIECPANTATFHEAKQHASDKQNQSIGH